MRAQLLSVKKSDIQQIYTQYSEPVLGLTGKHEGMHKVKDKNSMII